MAKIELPKAARDRLAGALSRHLQDEFEVDVKGFDAVFLLDWIIEHVGPYLYNQGVLDAQALVRKKAEDFVEAFAELEKPPPSAI